jgi:hypothetical protein
VPTRSRLAPVPDAPVPDAPVPNDRWSVEDSRSVRSVWIWRGFLLMSLIAVGIVVIFASNGKTTLAALWGVIAAGWFGISMFLWKKHSELDR